MRKLLTYLKTLPTSHEREVSGVLQLEDLEFWDYEGNSTYGVKAVLFEVESESSETPHAVVITIHPRKKEWVMWCVSTKSDAKRVEQATGRTYNHACGFWKWKDQGCPHTRSVGAFLLENPDVVEQIEAFLGAETGTVTTEDLSSTLLSLLRLRRNVLLFGETGGGKTYSVIQAYRTLAEEGELDQLIQIDCSAGMEDIDLLGRTVPMTPSRKILHLQELRKKYDYDLEVLSQLIGDWDFEDGELVRAFKLAREGRKVLVLFEEITRASSKALNLLLKAMDPVRGSYRLWNFLTGEIVEASTENLVFVATANVGASYSGTESLDEALLDRFQAFLYVGYNEKKEKEILKNLGLDDETVQKMMQTVKLLREKYRNGYIAKPFSTRLIKNWGELVANGMDPVEAFGLIELRLVETNEHGQPDAVQTEEIESVIRRVFG